MSAYADTSFLISLYTPDSNSEVATAQLFEREDFLSVTPFGQAEFVNSIELRVFCKEISPRQAEGSMGGFQKDLDTGLFLVSRPVPAHAYERALLLSRQHTRQMGTRGMDVLHVAIALELGAEIFYTFDQGQARLAKRAGLTVRPGR